MLSFVCASSEKRPKTFLTLTVFSMRFLYPQSGAVELSACCIYSEAIFSTILLAFLLAFTPVGEY